MIKTLVLGGGCFWCIEAVYVMVRGVSDVESGYCNGHTVGPSYEEVGTGRTGHNEVVKLEYETEHISTRELLEIFFAIHDPTTQDRQGHDVGPQYRSGIYFTEPQQAQTALDVIAELTTAHAFEQPILTEVLPLARYSAAEAYHQDFFERNPEQGYCMAVAGPKVEKFKNMFSHLLRQL